MDENVHPPIVASNVNSHHAPQSHIHCWTFPKLFVVGQRWWKHASCQPISLDNCCFKAIPNTFVGCPNFMEWMFISYVQLQHLKTFEPMKVLKTHWIHTNKLTTMPKMACGCIPMKAYFSYYKRKDVITIEFMSFSTHMVPKSFFWWWS
jgi:hypothetical protein